MSVRSRHVSSCRLLARASGCSLALAGVLLVAGPSFAATWQNNVNYGGSTTMDLYVPDKVDASPGIVVSLHYCGGNSSNAHGWFQSLADTHGFIIIAPGAGGNCFDATPARSGERDAITKMVSYVIMKNNADKTRVFAAGASSGACMTQALLAAYPEVFAAGSVLAGVPAGAWTGGNAYGWTTPDARTAAEWGDIVRKAGPMGFAGPWPRIQLWHGTSDTTLTYSQNFPSEVEQWTNVLMVSTAMKSSVKESGMQDTWERNTYAGAGSTVVLETNVAQGAPHDLSGRGLWNDVVRFFGLDKDAPDGGTGGSGGSGGAAGGASGGGSSGGSTTGGNGSTTGGTGSTIGGTAATSGAPGAGGSSSGGMVNGNGGSGLGGVSNVGQAGAAGQASSSGGSSSNNIGGLGSVSTPNNGSGEDGGCSFHARNTQSSLAALVGLGAAGLGALLRRRRAA